MHVNPNSEWCGLHVNPKVTGYTDMVNMVVRGTNHAGSDCDVWCTDRCNVTMDGVLTHMIPMDRVLAVANRASRRRM